MTDTPIEPVAADPLAVPRPEEEVADAVRDGAPVDPAEQPAAGGSDDGAPVQGDGAPDSH